MMKNEKKILVMILSVFLITSMAAGCGAGSKEKPVETEQASVQVPEAAVTYDSFKELPSDQKKEVFSSLSGQEIYDLVKNSDEDWPVTSYDLISPENAKETIILFDNNGDLHFNLAWPKYGGFEPESIASIGDLTGTADVSRDGGDGGYSMSYGKNADGSYPNDSQRSVPKSSATVRTGTLDIDQYKKVIDIVTNGESEESRLDALEGIGYNEEIAKRFLEDQTAWLTRDEVAGPDNIAEGAASVNNDVESHYGYYGITAPWKAGNLDLKGGSGQMETLFSWGTLCDSGLIRDTGTAEIN